MSNNLTQTRLDLFYMIQVQKTIPEYVSIRKMKVHEKRIRIGDPYIRAMTLSVISEAEEISNQS